MHPVKLIWALRAIGYKLILDNIGCMTYIGKPCFIEGGKKIAIGKKTRIFPGIRMEAIGSGEIKIGDNCAIEQNVHIISYDSVLNIGNNTTISANVFISNVDHAYTDISKSVMQQSKIKKETNIGEGCFIGFGAVILPGTTLGKHCIVGANSVIKGEFPDYCVIVGSPGTAVKIYDMEKKQWKKRT